VQAHTHTYVYKCCIYIDIHTYTVKNTLSKCHLHNDTLLVFHSHAYTHTHTHAHVHTYICVYMYQNICIHTHIYKCTCMYTYIYIFTHTHTRTYIHTHTCPLIESQAHTHTYIRPPVFSACALCAGERSHTQKKHASEREWVRVVGCLAHLSNFLSVPFFSWMHLLREEWMLSTSRLTRLFPPNSSS